VPDLRGAHEVVVVQVDELERRRDLVVGELRWQLVLGGALLLLPCESRRLLSRHIVVRDRADHRLRPILLTVGLFPLRGGHLAQCVVETVHFRAELRVCDGHRAREAQPHEHVTDLFDTAVGLLLLERHPAFHVSASEYVQ
jgi:hypothetical protein